MADCSLSNVDLLPSSRDETACVQFILRKTNFRQNWVNIISLETEEGPTVFVVVVLFCFYIFVLGAVGTFIPEYISRNFCFDTGWLLRWVDIKKFLSICVICCPLVYVVPSTERLYWISQRFCTKMYTPWGGIQQNRIDHSIRNRRGIVQKDVDQGWTGIGWG